LAHEPSPTYADFQNGWRWWLAASQIQRQCFVLERRRLVDSRPAITGSIDCYTTGSTGMAKHYRWGPCYDALYAWLMHDLVRAGSRLGRVACAALMSTSDIKDSAIHIFDTPTHPVVDRWLRISIGPQPLAGLADALVGHDVIVAPGHYEIMDRYGGFAAAMDPDALVLSTAEAVTSYLYRSAGQRVRDWMRCWDGGATFYTCEYGNRHLVDMLAAVAVVDGQLISSDLFNLAQPFVNYANGDRVTLYTAGHCRCGLDTINIAFTNRQDSLYVTTPSGVVANYAMFQSIMAKATGILGLSGEFDLMCFGYSLARSYARFEYLKRDLGGRRLAFESLVAELALERLGFESVHVTANISSAERKFKRFYNLDA
jgi:hypothetical protein